MAQRINIYSLLALIFLSSVSTLTSAAQESDNTIAYRAETRATFSGGENSPFWLVSNLHGLSSPQLNNGYVRGSVFKYLSDSSRFSWGAGVDLVAAWRQPAAFRVQQLYAEMRYRKLWISIGAREFTPLYNDDRLSSGDLLFSGNAMPIPQLRIGTDGFAPFWGTKGWFSVNAYLAYGFFTDSRWQSHWVSSESGHTKNVLYCSRALRFSIGNHKAFPLSLDLGIEMATQFGGTSYRVGETVKMPTNFKAWIRAFIPTSGGDDTPEGEQFNVQGNMNGEYTAAIKYEPAPGWKLKAYFEHYFDDHSQMFLEYGFWKDGLWGLQVDFPKNPFVSKFVYEYVATKDQTGAVMNVANPEVPEQVSGRDNYFNNYIYNCWQNWGMMIGTPLAISPLYNRSHILTMYNTRFLAHHFGIEGRPLPGLDWRFLLTFTRNYGSYWRPLPDIMNNCSGLVEVNYNFNAVKGLYAKAALAWDYGKLLGNNLGGMISIGYEGDFRFKR